MKKIIDFFIEKSLIVNLFTVMIFFAGGISLYHLQKETFPQVDFDVILINTIYPGSSAEDVEKLVTIPIERKLKSVDGIKELNALSAENRSIIYLEVEPDENIDEILEDTKNAINLVDDLPENVKVPVISSLNNKRRGVLKIPLVDKRGNYNFLRKISKKLRDEIERIPEVAQVKLQGYRVDEIRIEINPEKLNEFDLTIGEIDRAVKERNLNLSAGTIETKKGDVFVRTLAEYKTVEDIKKVVVRSNNSGFRVLLSDVATVERVPTESSILERSNGERAIFVDIKTRQKADILNSTNKIKNKIENFFKDNKYPQIEYRFADDLSYYVKRRLNILKSNGLTGLGLVFLCLLAFLNFRTAFITSLGAPIAFMVSFLLMDSLGVSINLISMFALILVLGMLVDDSIIVAEQFYQKLEAGMKPKEAARQAAYETIKPVTATVLTTIVAFGSLFFMGGIMGKFLWSVPAVVIICLLASLFECFVILPSHLADFCRLSKKQGKRWYDRATEVYGVFLTTVLRYSKSVIFLFFLLLIGSLILAKGMSFELFPGDDVRTVYLQIKGEVGSPLVKTDESMMKLEKMAMSHLKKEEFEQIKAQVGTLRGSQSSKQGSHYGSLTLYLTPPDERERSTDEILKDLTTRAKKLVPEYIITTKKEQGGPPRGKAVDIQLAGNSLEELLLAANEVEKALKKERGITVTEIDFEKGKEQIAIEIDDAEAKRLGLSTTLIALELRKTFSGDEVTEIRESDEDIKIKLFLDDKSRSRIESINLLSVMNNQGRRIPITKVAKLKKQPGAFIIRRLDRKRVISVQASIDKSRTKSVKVAKVFKPKVEDILKKYPDLTFIFGGENKDTKESMGRLAKSALIAIFCIFIILVTMFNSLIHPIVVMSAIPLGLIGVIWTFKMAGQSLGFMALMGVVALVGVVVNDSIVLVAFINGKREEGLDLYEAVIVAAKSRFRPIILTTFTTVAGLLPIAHPFVSKIFTLGNTVDGDPFIQPMAMSFAWGLLFASLVTLFFVPCNYIVFARSKMYLIDLFKQSKNTLRP